MANAEIMKLFAEYQANSHLRLSFEESEAKDKRGARAATDRKRESFRDRDSDLSSMSSTDSGTSLLISHVGQSQLQRNVQISKVNFRAKTLMKVQSNLKIHRTTLKRRNRKKKPTKSHSACLISTVPISSCEKLSRRKKRSSNEISE